MFTPRQQAIYRPLVSRAWLAACAASGCPPNDRIAQDKWYRLQLREALGVWTTKECNATSDFDLLGLRFAQIANDQYLIERFSVGAERRLRWLIDTRLRQVGVLETGRPYDWAYAKAIHAHMGLPLSLEDCPLELAEKIFQALDTQYRRIRVARGMQDTRNPRFGSRRAKKEHHGV
jgi:hypothetical protein